MVALVRHGERMAARDSGCHVRVKPHGRRISCATAANMRCFRACERLPQPLGSLAVRAFLFGQDNLLLLVLLLVLLISRLYSKFCSQAPPL